MNATPPVRGPSAERAERLPLAAWLRVAVLASMLALPGCRSLSFPEESATDAASNAAGATVTEGAATARAPDGDATDWVPLSRAGRESLRVGDLDHAQENFVAALRATESLPPDDTRVQTTLGYLLRLVAVYQRQGLFAEAGQVLMVVGAQMDAGRMPGYDALAPVLDVQARELRRRADTEGAIAAYRRALTLPAPAGGGSNPSTLDLRHALAQTLLDADRPAEAAPLLAEVLRETERRWGPESLPVAAVLEDVARAQHELNDSEGAGEALVRALDIRSAQAPGSAGEAMTLNALAWLYVSEDRNAEARTFATRALGILDALGLGGAPRAAVLDTKATAEYRMGEVALAEQDYRLAIEARDGATPDLQRQLEGVLTGYATLLRETGRVSEADAIEARLAAERARP